MESQDMTQRPLRARLLLVTLALLATACEDACEVERPPPPADHGPMAEGIYSRMGEVAPYATDEQRATFDRGAQVALHRFTRAEGLGPAFNVTFCGSCHEKPTPGGSGGMYRNFFLTGVLTDDGAFFPGESAGAAGGVIRMFYYGEDEDARPVVPEQTNVIAQRNPIPFFGTGLLAELSEDEILKRSDPDDTDGDGISGRPNYDRGFVGRFGRKAQTVSIEGFIRGPLFNHIGISSDPLDEEQRAALPVDSSGGGDRGAALEPLGGAFRTLFRFAQAAAPDGPLVDDDDAPDPELSTDDLFDLVSFAMLMGAPEPEPLTDETRRGSKVFDAVHCSKCHTPRMPGPRGPLPLYSDILLHDMGDELADGLVQREATGREFRTQPLWGITAVGPYLHDGRAHTIDEAIRMHAGEASQSRTAYINLSEESRALLLAFLESLGGRDQKSAGLIPPGTPIAAVGEAGGPTHALNDEETADFLAGRDAFDREFGLSEGLGSPRMNGDSCRACHFEPAVGGAGPRGVNVMRHGILNSDGAFVPPSVGTILHKSTKLEGSANRPQPEANVFEHRQTPSLFGLGLLDNVSEETILANADPDDLDDDGISGKASWTDGPRIGRFGWKAQVPSLAEFVRDAIAAELGMTQPQEAGLTFGRVNDNDDVQDPELDTDFSEPLLRYLELLGRPPGQPATDAAAAARGEALFESTGCVKCHVPTLDSPSGPVPAYTDLLLHEILPVGAAGIEDASATMTEFRTAPLWGIAGTAPYFHTGEADTLDEAVRLHDGEAVTVREAYEALSDDERADLLTFVETL